MLNNAQLKNMVGVGTNIITRLKRNGCFNGKYRKNLLTSELWCRRYYGICF